MDVTTVDFVIIAPTEVDNLNDDLLCPLVELQFHDIEDTDILH